MSAKRRLPFLVVAIFSIHITAHAQEPTTLTYGLVVDNSGSLREHINEVVESGKLIVGSNQPGDKTFIVRFVGREKISVAQDFTSDQAALVEALDRMYVEGGSSAIIDAVYFSAQHLARDGGMSEQSGRRVLILVTDGDERGSFYKQEKLFALLREENVKVYAIGLVESLERQGAPTRRRAIKFLSKLAEETGGRAYFPASKSEVKGIASDLLADIRR